MKLFLDIDTQVDFLFPAGALYAPGAERVIPPAARLNRFAAEHRIPLVSSMCAHPEDAREFAEWAPHCVAGTAGQRKPAVTLLEKRAVIPNRAGEFDISGAEQIVVEKDHLDVFDNPNFTPLLHRIGADEFFVYGVFIEYCVKCAVAGLLKRGGGVYLVSDATAAVNSLKGRTTLDAFISSGVKVVSLDEALAL